ncbi:MAG: electron transfer flavoprotein subunit alpha/FixB family protein [Actinomycetota bacterium]|nr:electron transfer flavoprotein subunit alpha/FixB family protein [Actinomycetota bacterium]
MPDQNDIYIIAELSEEKHPTPLTLELMGLGKELAAGMGGDLHAVMPGEGMEAAAVELSRYGASGIFVLDHPALCDYNPDIYLPVLEGFFTDRSPRAIIISHTSIGADLGPRLAFALGAGLVTDCVGARAEAGEIRLVRPVYGGNALATLRATTDTVLATLRARVGSAPSPSGESEVTLVEAAVPAEIRIGLRGRERAVSAECPLEEAAVVVTGGRGIGGADGFEQLRELARLFGGAVGASRPPVDSGWAPTTCQVGITGKVVAPDIYIAVAISGSSQHLSGMSDSGKVVAINKDPEAYIFSVSDYGVVGDWRQVLPSFTARCRDILNE